MVIPSRTSTFVCIVLCLCLLEGTADAAHHTINVGLTLPITGFPSISNILFRIFMPGFDYFQQWIKENPIRLPNSDLTLDVNIHIVNDEYSIPGVARIYRSLMMNESISFLFAPFGTATSYAAAQAVDAEGWTLLSWTNRDANIQEQGRRVLPLIIPDNNNYEVVLAPLRVAGAKTVVVLQRATIRGRSNLKGRCLHPAFEKELRLQGLQRVAFISLFGGIDRNVSKQDANQVRNITMETLRVIEQHDPDAWLFCDTGDTIPVISAMQSVGYTPRAFVSQNTIPRSFDYETIVSQFDIDLNFPQTEWFGNMTHLAADFKEKTGFTLTGSLFSTLLPGLMLKVGLEKMDEAKNLFEIDSGGRLQYANVTRVCSGNTMARDAFISMQDDFARTLIQTRIDTVVGTIAWDTLNRQRRNSFMGQIRSNTRYTIAPLSVQEKNYVYPMPTWEERIFDPKFGHWTEILASLLAIIAILSCAFWGVVLFLGQYRFLSSDMHRTFKAGSPLFMWIIILGGIVLSTSVFFSFPNMITRYSCILRVWLIDLGFVLLFGPFFAKTYRIERLWTTHTTSVFKISNVVVLAWVLGLLAIHVVILIIMTVLGDIKQEIEVVDDIRIINNYYKCTNNLFFDIVTYVLVGLNGILIIFGAVLAFRIRRIPLNIYNESKIIFFSVYNVIFFSIIVLVLSTPIRIDRFIKFFLISFFKILGAALTLNALFAYKVFSKPNTDKQHTSGTGSANSTTSERSAVRPTLVASRNGSQSAL